MPSSFNLSIGTILRHEGGLADNKNDPGGITKFGVSLRWLVAHGHEVEDIIHTDHPDPLVIRNLTVEEATAIYRREWWDKYSYAGFDSQRLATKVFDMAVNMGAMQAHKLLQRALLTFGLYKIVVDGILGPATLADANRLTNANPVTEVRVLNQVVTTEVKFYQDLANNKPQFREFLRGWLIRAYEV